MQAQELRRAQLVDSTDGCANSDLSSKRIEIHPGSWANCAPGVSSIASRERNDRARSEMTIVIGDITGVHLSENAFQSHRIGKRLWDAADDLRANSKLKSSEYSVPVLGLIFLRYADTSLRKRKRSCDHRVAGAGRSARLITRRTACCTFPTKPGSRPS